LLGFDGKGESVWFFGVVCLFFYLRKNKEKVEIGGAAEGEKKIVCEIL